MACAGIARRLTVIDMNMACAAPARRAGEASSVFVKFTSRLSTPARDDEAQTGVSRRTLKRLRSLKVMVFSGNGAEGKKKKGKRLETRP